MRNGGCVPRKRKTVGCWCVSRVDEFDTRCPVPHRSGCFRPSDLLAGWDSHPPEISDFHGVLVCWRVSRANELMTQPRVGERTSPAFQQGAAVHLPVRKSSSRPTKHPQTRQFFDKWTRRNLKSGLADDFNSCQSTAQASLKKTGSDDQN